MTELEFWQQGSYDKDLIEAQRLVDLAEDGDNILIKSTDKNGLVQDSLHARGWEEIKKGEEG